MTSGTLHLQDSSGKPAFLPSNGEWQADPGFGVYVHIPFCRHRCHYCDFNTYEGLDALHAPYARALEREIRAAPGPRPATSVFFGGGTPTLLAADVLGRLLGAIRDTTGTAPGAEITVEANPETVDERYFEALLGYGFNRFSIGIQSLAPGVLRRLGREHSADTALAALAAARSAGVTNLNADLIFGSPWEGPSDWLRSLHGVIEEDPEHVSAYALTVEEGTPLATQVATGREPDVDPDVQAERHAVAEDVLGAAGYVRYEISNWSRPGRASRHNVLYWSAGDYAGFGAGAHGHEGGRRYWRTRLPRDFVAAVSAGAGSAGPGNEMGAGTEAGGETLSPQERVAEAMMLGLRLRSGIDTAAFDARWGRDERLETVASGLCAQGWLERADGWLRLSRAGTMVANDILCRFL
ncbi:MAG: radical SAM family heme chaperone HemW [Actinomycetota bacterium]|nr:radical SAM family heme chaperone HemW [Actinomycetota bacterium]